MINYLNFVEYAHPRKLRKFQCSQCTDRLQIARARSLLSHVIYKSHPEDWQLYYKLKKNARKDVNQPTTNTSTVLLTSRAAQHEIVHFFDKIMTLCTLLVHLMEYIKI